MVQIKVSFAFIYLAAAAAIVPGAALPVPGPPVPGSQHHGDEYHSLPVITAADLKKAGYVSKFSMIIFEFVSDIQHRRSLT